ncbi:hypothetical protein [Methanolobus sp.]|nr:hypothetical protein [Methanolobus sp.]
MKATTGLSNSMIFTENILSIPGRTSGSMAWSVRVQLIDTGTGSWPARST